MVVVGGERRRGGWARSAPARTNRRYAMLYYAVLHHTVLYDAALMLYYAHQPVVVDARTSEEIDHELAA